MTLAAATDLTEISILFNRSKFIYNRFIDLQTFFFSNQAIRSVKLHNLQNVLTQCVINVSCMAINKIDSLLLFEWVHCFTVRDNFSVAIRKSLRVTVWVFMKKTTLSTIDGARELLLASTVSPTAEKCLSNGELVGGMGIGLFGRASIIQKKQIIKINLQVTNYGISFRFWLRHWKHWKGRVRV